MPIRSVILDFGNVIAFPVLEERVAAAAADCGVSVDVFLPALWADRLAYDGGMDPAQYWGGIGAALGRTFDDGQIARMVRHEIEFWNRFDERVLAWIGTLRSCGFRTGILSNLPRPIGESLRATPGFLEHFDHVTFSYELRLVKPQAAIYEHAIRGLGVRPEEALFIDDRPENVEGARAAGLHAEQFYDWDTFAGVPERYGLPAADVARRQ